MDARQAILDRLRAANAAPKPLPALCPPALASTPVETFIARARASIAAVHEIASALDVPVAIRAILDEATAPLRLHVPANSPLNNLPWQRAPGLALSSLPPSGEDSALSAADHALAETGTLVFLSGPRSPSSWHFRPGRSFVLLQRAAILPTLEDVLAILRKLDRMPATVNLVTGPSRTADIEQTIELGAHGPREMHILIAGS